MKTIQYSKLGNKCLEDKLDRQKHIEPLTNLLTNIKDESFVMTVSAPYGGGKTFFIDMWQKHLQANGCKTLYYNAWENDFSVNPLISFVSSFNGLESYFTTKETFQEQIKNLPKSGKKVFLKNLPKIARMIFSKIFCKKIGLEAKDLESIFKLACDLVDEEENSKKTKKNLDLIKKEQEQKNIVKLFKESLISLISNITKESHCNYPTDKLIIFIDDLDRCRPDYAIKFLEYIKHIFDVKNCIFVLAVDEEQLKSAVEVVYGSKNAEGFLKRIIDFKFQLPEQNTRIFINMLIDKLKWTDSNVFYTNLRDFPAEVEKYVFVEVIYEISTIFKLTARDLEHIFQDLNIIFKSLNENDVSPTLYAITYVIRNFFYKIKNEIVDTLQKPLKGNDENIFIAFHSYVNHFKLQEYYPNYAPYRICLTNLLDCLLLSQVSNKRELYKNNNAVVILPQSIFEHLYEDIYVYKQIEIKISNIFCEKKLENLEQ